MDVILAWLQANQAIIALVVSLLIGLAILVARGKGKELAQLALSFLLQQSQAGWESVSQAELEAVASTLYDATPGTVWKIPWKIFISKAQVQKWAWDGWCKLKELLNTQVGNALKAELWR